MSPLFSRLAALLLAVLAGGVVVLGVVAPLAANQAARAEEVSELRDALARFEAAIAEAPAAGTVEITDDALLKADSDALAAAMVQSRLSAVIERSGAVLRSVRADTPEPMGDLRKTPVTVELEADLKSLQRLLHGVETSVPYIIVEELTARRMRAPETSREPARVSVRLRVYGVVASSQQS